MMTTITRAATLAAALLFAGSAVAETWTLDGDASRLAFGSIKKDTVGEVHGFEALEGKVAADGTVTVTIDLASVETWIDIRNERMIEHVFAKTPTATLTAQVDMDELAGLEAGAGTLIDVEGTLSFLGRDVPVETEMYVVRLTDDTVLATTNDMLFVPAASLGIDAGLDKLMELAKLPGITRTSPVTMRLMFRLDDKEA